MRAISAKSFKLAPYLDVWAAVSWGCVLSFGIEE